MKLTPGTKEHGGKVYKTLMFEDNKIEYTFTIENADLDVGEGCSYYNNDASNADKYGLMYTWEAAMKTKPKGWDLIDWPRWNLLQEKFTATELVDGGSSGFNFQYGGRWDKGIREGTKFIEKEELGFYWSENIVNPGHYKTADLYIFEPTSPGARIITNVWGVESCMLSIRWFYQKSLLYPEQNNPTD